MSRESSLSNCLEGCLCGRGPTKKIHLERKRDGATRPPPSNVNNVGNIDSIDERTSSPSNGGREGGFFRKRFLQFLFRNDEGDDPGPRIFGHGLRERMNDGGVNFLPEPRTRSTRRW